LSGEIVRHVRKELPFGSEQATRRTTASAGRSRETLILAGRRIQANWQRVSGLNRCFFRRYVYSCIYMTAALFSAGESHVGRDSRR
jgi:hypothetical protein